MPNPRILTELRYVRIPAQNFIVSSNGLRQRYNLTLSEVNYSVDEKNVRRNHWFTKFSWKGGATLAHPPEAFTEEEIPFLEEVQKTRLDHVQGLVDAVKEAIDKPYIDISEFEARQP